MNATCRCACTCACHAPQHHCARCAVRPVAHCGCAHQPQPATPHHRCGCACHVRPAETCCALPPPPDNPKIVDIPDQPPAPPLRTAPTPVWQDPNRPPDGDPGTINWFRQKLATIRTNGPTLGPRKDEYLPYVLMRTSSSDRGNRALSGTFWESPDIFVLPNASPDVAPLQPPALGGSAVAAVPNTLYAHVWNVGNSPASGVRVEFYWFNPSLGITRSDSNFIDAAYCDLGNRFTHFPEWKVVEGPTGEYLSRGAHAIVRCPTKWVPSYENNGHECLVVRVFEPMMDPLPVDQFSSAADRHVAQRNIAVVVAQSPAKIDLPLDLGYVTAPGTCEVDVQASSPASMEWLQLYVGRNGTPLRPSTAPLVTGFLPPALRGARTPDLTSLDEKARGVLLRTSERFERGCEPVQISLHAGCDGLSKGEAHVVRVLNRLDGRLVGGYTVVLLAP